MPELHLGALFLFLVPGLLAYCALYGVFGGGDRISVAPPPSNSVETLTIILLTSLVAHAVTIVLIALNDVVCRTGLCVRLPVDRRYFDAFDLVSEAMRQGSIDALGAKLLLLAALVQGGATYFAISLWLRRLTRKDRLPFWLYGWTADWANLLDNANILVVAYVLTNHEVAGRSVVYAGAIKDMAIDRDGIVTRITLEGCERYLVAMDKALTSRKALSYFELMTIERSSIRNVAFEPLILADPALPPALAA